MANDERKAKQMIKKYSQLTIFFFMLGTISMFFSIFVSVFMQPIPVPYYMFFFIGAVNSHVLGVILTLQIHRK